MTPCNRWFWRNALPPDKRNTVKKFDGWREIPGKKSLHPHTRIRHPLSQLLDAVLASIDGRTDLTLSQSLQAWHLGSPIFCPRDFNRG